MFSETKNPGRPVHWPTPGPDVIPADSGASAPGSGSNGAQQRTEPRRPGEPRPPNRAIKCPELDET